MAKRGRKKAKGLPQNGNYAGPGGAIHPLGFSYMTETRPLKATPMSAIIPQLFAQYGLGRQLALSRFIKVWEEIRDSEPINSIPAAALKRIRFINLSRGALLFEVGNNALFQELKFYQANILETFQQKFPTERIKTVKITVKTSGE